MQPWWSEIYSEETTNNRVARRLAIRNLKSTICNSVRRCNSMVEWQLPKLHTRVRFPSPAVFGIFVVERRTSIQMQPTQLPLQNSFLFSAEEFFEGLKEFVREISGFFSKVVQLLRELHLFAAVNFAPGGGNFVSRKIDFVGGAGRFATSGREMI